MLLENANLPGPGCILIKMELVLRLSTCDLGTREQTRGPRAGGEWLSEALMA